MGIEVKKIIGGVHFSWSPFLYYELMLFKKKDVVCVVENNIDMQYINSIIIKISPDINVLCLPEYESSEGDRLPFNFGIAASRASCLSQILSFREKKIILVTKKSLLYSVPPLSYFQETYELHRNQFLSMGDFQRILETFGYKRFELTEKQGQFSVRGGLIDVYPVTSRFPSRVDFFGNSVESIKLFDTDSQKSIGEQESVKITKASEISVSEESLKIFKEKYKDCDERTLESLEEYRIFNGIEWFLPYFFSENLETVYDYFSADSLFIFDSSFDIIPRGSFSVIKTQQFACDGENFAISNNFNGNIRTETGFKDFLAHSSQYKKIIISMLSVGAMNILRGIFQENNFGNFTEIDGIVDAKDGISVIQTNLREGFIIPENKVIFYTEKQLFGYMLRTSPVKKSGNKFFKNYSNLIPGDYIVHRKYGVAVFEGLQTIKVSDISHDFLCLIYKNNDRLFVPVENIDLVSRYGNEDDSVEVDKLGGMSWGNRREKVRQKLLIIADNLLKIAAKRKLNKVEPLEVDHEKYEQFCKKFPYMETDDQNLAINDVINDLCSTTPMDRLICGDVGFGKTEVALRGAFVVASSNKQVLLLAPTTILVNQHYKNFVKRFAGSGVEICQLSRFLTKKDQKQNINRIEKGEVQIVIATHTALSPRVKFRDLNLLIIDEEQHFGVKQKEFIKSAKSDVHVLAMTATPIPRTLQMAMSGVRDLSIIASPPVDRLPVKTYVSDFEDTFLERAIGRELSRGGQVFIVSPRVEFLDDLYKKFSKMFPKPIIKVAHGKTLNLESVITDFCDQKIDVLISTNIIDSGIDIQNANTMIVYRADMFGLSQLYQLRGRVGRLSNVQGYCYLLTLSQKKKTEDAIKRLEVIQNLNALGSGFTLASHDLDIRGAGNIVGDEQSGHVKDVGVELYQKMLEGAVLMRDVNDDIAPQINIGVPVLIPGSYIEDRNLRMTMYRRIGDLTTLSEVDDMELEISDRFGKIPQELKNLLDVIKIKIFCIIANIDRIDIGRSGMTFSFYNDECKRQDRLLEFISKNQAHIKLRSDQKIVLQKKWNSERDRTMDVIKMVRFLS